MKKRIYLNLLLVTTMAVLITTGLLVVIFYNFHIDKEKESIKDYANVTANYLELSNINSIEKIVNNNPNIRATLINKMVKLSLIQIKMK